jgi:hypothetical protein
MASTKLQPKEVNYLNKNFNNFKADLVNYAKDYFPNSYADFNEASPGMMFIEMASYVGDVLSFYIDEQFRESLLAYAEEKKTIYDIAQSYGYKPTIATPSTTKLDFWQTVPATGTGDSAKPNYDYAYTINAGSMVESSQYGKTFRTLDQVNFSFSSSLDPTTVEIYEVNDSSPTKFLLKKSVRAVSGTITTETFSFSDAKAYERITLANKGVLEIISVTDSNGNKWYEVESLAQDLVFDDVANTAENDPNLAGYNDTTPYLLKLKRTNKRFKIRITIEGKTQLIFGSGTASGPDEEVIPNPSQVGNSFTNTNFLNNASALDPANFLNTAVYGQAPANTILTIQYSYGGGVQANVPAKSITTLRGINKSVAASGLDAALLGETEASIAVSNSIPATGGRGEETLTEIKENTKQYFQAQNRSVSKEDYITRVYNLPPKYGNVQKIYITQDDQIETGQGIIQDGIIDVPTLEKLGGEVSIAELLGENGRVTNPMALNFYVLGYDQNKKLVKVNEATKRNIKSYLGPYRVLTDAINLKDAYVINIGIRFAIYVKKGYNKNEILLKAISKVKNYFDIDKWQVNQPIILQDVAYEISLVEGVNNVVPPLDENPNKDTIVVTNKFKEENGYSGNIYNVKAATSKEILYPSLDPSIFEIRYPNIDIVGKVLGDY